MGRCSIVRDGDRFSLECDIREVEAVMLEQQETERTRLIDTPFICHVVPDGESIRLSCSPFQPPSPPSGQAPIGKFVSDVVSWVKRCLQAGGTPIFKTQYAGRRFAADRVLAVCFGASDRVRGGFFEEVPPEDMVRFETERRDYVWIAEKYGDEELREMVRARST